MNKKDESGPQTTLYYRVSFKLFNLIPKIEGD